MYIDKENPPDVRIRKCFDFWPGKIMYLCEVKTKLFFGKTVWEPFSINTDFKLNPLQEFTKESQLCFTDPSFAEGIIEKYEEVFVQDGVIKTITFTKS